jgi:membrane protease YdiL (CAAX protease family)
MEVCLVLLSACGSSFLNALFSLRYGPHADPTSANERWLIGMFQQVIALLLLAYVLSRRSLRFKDFGLSWSLKDAVASVFVTAFAYLSYLYGAMLVQTVYHSIYGAFAKTLSGKDFYSHPPLVAIPYALLNPFFEELIVRAYLMTEVRELTGSVSLAIAASVAVQFSYHIYYGWVGALSLSFQFLVFALYYARTQRILPVVLAHGFFDIYAISRLM